MKKYTMRNGKISRILASASLLTTAFFCIGWADTWEGLKVGVGDITSVSAEFTQEKHMKILAKPLISGGVFHFQDPKSLRWEYKHPISSIMIMHNGETNRYIKRDGQIIHDAGLNQNAMQVIFDEIILWLSGRFNENPAFAAELIPGRNIVLVPKDESLARFIQRIELNLSDQPGVIQSVLIYESESAFTKLAFKNVVLNQSLPESIFRKIP